MEYRFIRDLENFFRSRFEKFPAEPVISAERCPAGMKGDFTVNCFRIGRFCGNPAEAAKLACEFLAAHPDVEFVESVKAFVNVTIKAAAVHRDGVADIEGLLDSARLPEGERRRILIEYSAPNTNKPQHLGHVRNNTLGMSLASVLKRVGHDVIEINLVNDRGIHICKSMIAYQRFGNGCTPESTGIKGDHLVGNFYVEYNKALSAEIKELRAAHPEFAERDDESLFLETELGAATRKMLQDWEAGDESVRTLWSMMNGWVFDGFAKTYERMGIHFDHTYLESQTYLLGK
ncbi:MAG: arginine--tRNA ligase, partial [Victivallaceae bacterium]|nr:arginine--tRNA ligase [Victivallaceae bacterium]